jgi:hypothetical protein
MPGVEAALYERALYCALDRTGYRNLYGVATLEADEYLRGLSTPTLQELGRNLVAEALRHVGYPKVSLTRFHRFAMCVADHLVARDASIP